MSTRIEEMPMFNASIAVTELLMKTLENSAKSLAMRCITEAALRHGFDASDEIRALGLENLSLIRKQMAKKSVGLKKDKVVSKNDKKDKKDKKSVFPMPFIPELVDMAGCQGLAFNRGLFTQCAKKCMENGNFCSGCQTEADKNASGCPDCGTVQARCATGLYEFKDSKGRSPVSYIKVLEKVKLNQESAIEEAGKLHIVLDNEHFVLAEAKEKSKKSKGRPKKTVAVQADNVNDLFAKLSSESDDEVIEDLEEEKPVKAAKAKLSEEEKAAKKAALEEERALKKALAQQQRDAKIAEERAEKEAKRKAEAEIKKAERDAKIAQEKALAQQQREAKRLQEKEEREAKRLQEKALAEQKKEGSKKSVKKALAEPNKEESKPDQKPDQKPVPVTADAPVTAKVSVTRIQIAGKAYLKSSTNILYDPTSKEEVGIWDPETKTIKELPQEDDDEEEEEDYDA